MKTSRRTLFASRLRNRRSQRGVALVITLSFLLIATVIIVAFFTRARTDYRASSTYSQSVQSDFLALGAMDGLIAQTIEEIQDPLKSVPSPAGLPVGTSWYEPLPDSNNKYPSMVPDRTSTLGGVGTAYQNLIKQSKQGQPFYTGTPNSNDGTNTSLASGIQTSPDSTTNRSINGKRWSLPALIVNGTALEITDAQTPYWIYVKSNGAPTSTVPGTGDAVQIVGRYAYNVYDVGGLININVAGNNEAQQSAIGTKGAAAFIDLTSIQSGSSNLLSQGNVQTILNWRAPSNLGVDWQNYGDPTKPITEASLKINDYLRIGANSGWLRNPSTVAGQGNQFLSRRDLIRFFKTNNLPDAALPFLTHFSVDADAPSFSPDTTHLQIQSGANLQQNKNKSLTNGDLATVNPSRSNPNTYITGFTLPNNRTENTPAFHRRFPLNRLVLVQTDPAARTAANSTPELVKKYFGLELDQNDYTWKYHDPEDSEDQIKTLNEVAQAGREPNFFEVLKSVIQAGSLGQFKQPVNNGSQTLCLEPRANQIDEQILRIGAAIIDQADADSYPTRIHFNYNSANGLGEIYGVEDLPYLYGMRIVAFTQPMGNARTILAQPTLWNPHEPNRSKSSGASPPENFQVVSHVINPISMSWPGTAILSNETMGFNWIQNGGNGINFRQPQGLLSPSYPGSASVTGGLYAIGGLEAPPFSGLTPSPYGLSAYGFLISNNATAPGKNTLLYFQGGPVQFYLQYKAGSMNYTYDRLWLNPSQIRMATAHASSSNLPAGSFGSLFSGRPDPNNSSPDDLRSDCLIIKSDPRSQRFLWFSDVARFTGGTNTSRRFATPEGATAGFYQGRTGITLFWKGDDVTSNWVFGSHNSGSGALMRGDLGYLTINSPGSVGFYYSDADGVVRRAMGGRANASPVNGGGALTSIIPNDVSVGAPMQSFPIQNATDEPGASYYKNRPVILNRPFRSVGELAMAFRDVPWKNLDFSFEESGDTGLLDAFTVYENSGQTDRATPLVAGKVNLNTCPKPVLKALINGITTQLPTATTATAFTDSSVLTNRLADRWEQYVSASAGSPSDNNPDSVNGPLRSLAEIVGRAYSSNPGFFKKASFSGLHPSEKELIGTSNDDKILTEKLSTIARDLADVGTTRTWNLMIDLTAQTGKIPAGSSLGAFIANSESRFWLFVSIDRFTGKVLSKSVERIIE